MDIGVAVALSLAQVPFSTLVQVPTGCVLEPFPSSLLLVHHRVEGESEGEAREQTLANRDNSKKSVIEVSNRPQTRGD